MKYCVYLTVYRGSKLPKRYVGSSSVDRVLNGYNGSVKSKKFKDLYRQEQVENKHLFKTRILQKFETQLEAIEAELRLQLAYDVVRSEKYINQSYAIPKGFFGRDLSGENHPMFGRHHTKETCARLSNSGKKAYEEGRSISPFALQDVSGENNPFFGKTHKPESIDKMRKPKKFVPKWQCPHCDKMYDAGNLDQHLKRTLGWGKDKAAQYRSSNNHINS